MGDALRYLLREGGQHHDRDVRIVHLDLAGRREDVSIIHIRHTDNQLKVTITQLVQRLLLGCHLRETGGIAKAQRGIFIKDLLVDASIVFQHESIIFSRDKQYIIYTLIHQIGKRSVPKHQVFQIRNTAHTLIL